jgi:site-specific DNA recombinase
MTKAVGYVRVSLDKQAARGISLAAQRERLTSYAALYDIELVAIEEDAGESAKTLLRPGLNRVLTMLESGEVEAVLVAKLDRLTRSARDLDTLIKRYFREGKGKALLSVAEQIDTRSASGRLVLSVLTAVSEWEREAIGERTSAALQHKKRLGQYTGGPVPYGYRLAADGVHLEPSTLEQEVILEAKKRKVRGWPLRRVGRSLTADGMATRHDRTWHPGQVARLLQASHGS